MRSVLDSLVIRDQNVSGSCAVAAGFATFLGPYDVKFRREMMTVHWPMCLVERGIPLAIDSVHPVYGNVLCTLFLLLYVSVFPILSQTLRVIVKVDDHYHLTD
jgi:hypothetical protein